MLKMSRNLTSKNANLENLFNNKQFRLFAPYFLEKSITMVEAERLSGIPRQTISSVIDKYLKIEGYRKHKYIEWDYDRKGKGLRLKVEILSDYFSQSANLSDDETLLLNEILLNKLISESITKDNVLLDMAIVKTLTLFLNLAASRYCVKKDPTYVERLENIMGLIPTLALNEKDSERIKLFNDYKVKFIFQKNNLLDNALTKIKNSKRFSVLIFPSDLYDLLLLRMNETAAGIRADEMGSNAWVKQFKEYAKSLKIERKKRTYDTSKL